jgi:DNA mismatch endonuclease, patch repair protein
MTKDVSSKQVYVPWASTPAARSVMQGNRSRDTIPERKVRSAAHKLGLRFYVVRRPLPDFPARADLVFPTAKVAVFVDGCFWHGCPLHGTCPRTNEAYWSEKIVRNKLRDSRVDHILKDAAWLPVRVWEHEDPERVARSLKTIVLSRRNNQSKTIHRL